MMCEAYTVMDLLPPVDPIERVWKPHLILTLSLLNLTLATEALVLLRLRKQRGDRMEAPRHHLGYVETM